MAKIKFDYEIARNLWRYWAQVDGDGLVWYPYWDADEKKQPSMENRHNMARRAVRDRVAAGVYVGVKSEDIEVETLTHYEKGYIRWVPERSVYLLDMRD